MTDIETLVYGEPIGVLVAALIPIADSGRIEADGMWHFEGRVDAPLMRALMRAEADLLIQDADRFGSADYDARTPEQRRADAFVELARRMGAAADRAR